MGNMDTTWQQVQEIIDASRNGIVVAVKSMLTRVDDGKKAELNQLCTELNCKIWLLLDEDGSNPFLIRPLMYVWFDGTAPPIMERWQKLLKHLGWASNLRITLKMIEKPYEGEALYAYPHT